MSNGPETGGAAPPEAAAGDGPRGTGPAFESYDRFLLRLVPAVERSPRSRKFLLGDRVRRIALDVLEALIDATYTRQRGHHCARVPRTHGSLDIRRPDSTEPRRVRDPFRSVKSPSPPPVVVAARAARG